MKPTVSSSINSKSREKTVHGQKGVSLNEKRLKKMNTVGNAGSSRISKSVFFPSKSMYKNALDIGEASHKPIQNDLVKVTKNFSDGNKVTVDSPSSRRNTTMLQRKSKELKTHSQTVSMESSTKKYKTNPEKKSNEIKTNLINVPSSKSNVTRTKDKLIREESSDTSEISERPRTATLRKGSIVNADIVGPNVPLKKTMKIGIVEPNSSSSKPDEPDVIYEDDFESYESDFEEYSSSNTANANDISGEDTGSISSEEESDKLAAIITKTSVTSEVILSSTYEERLDSGNYDLSEGGHKFPPHFKKYLGNVKSTGTEVTRNNPASLSDEGFEEQKSLQFINFLDAKKRYEAEQKTKLRRKRGEHILSMIRLDKVNFTIFSLSPVPYDIFIRTYGKHNAIGSYTQTGELNVDEEVQTDFIECTSKWTQNSMAFSMIENDVASPSTLGSNSYNEYSLNKFILSAGNLILRIQEEALPDKDKMNKKYLKDICFSEVNLSRIFEDIDEVTFS